MRKYIVAITLTLAASSSAARATNVQLTLTVTNPVLTAGTWTVTATLSDNQTLGIASFSIDVIGVPDPGGTGTVTIQQAADPAQTLKVSNPPYSVFRSNGVLQPPSLKQINASQDTVTAAESHNSSNLRFGDGLLTPATSPAFGLIPAGGPLVLATGQWSVTGGGGAIHAELTPAAYFTLFPLNYAPDDGGAVNTVFATTVLNSQAIFVGNPVPEPASLVSMVLGSVGLIAVVRRHDNSFGVR
jgi:hypothetical protein